MEWKMEIALYLCFFLTTGEGQPDPNGPVQVSYAIPLPQQALRLGQAPNPFINLPPGPISHARPCRRRNFGNTGWVPVPLPYDQPQNYNRDYQIESQPAVSELKPRSLTENNIPSIDNNEDIDRSSGVPEYSDRTGLAERNVIPNELAEGRKSNENKNQVTELADAVSDDFIATSKTAQNSISENVPEDTSNDRMASPDDSAECEKTENVDQDLITNANRRKNRPEQIQEKVIKLLSDCVQEARNDQEEDLPSNTRRAYGGIEASINSSPSNEKSESIQDTSRVAPHLQNPAKNADKWTADSRISLLNNGRVCYACSTYFDSSCWRPNATTTVKYCNKYNNACVTKKFRVDGKKLVIRDCGHTCNEPDSYGVNPKIDRCTMCQTDMCNSAYTFNINSLVVMFVIAAVKCTY